MAISKNIDLLAEYPVYVGDRPAFEMELSLISYDAESAQMAHLSEIDELLQFQNERKITWINISGLKDVESIRSLGSMYNIHPLTIEDILHTEQQSKTEYFENYKYLSLKTIQCEKRFPCDQLIKAKIEQEKKTGELVIDQVSLIIMKNTLITFQEIPGDPFGDIRKRILDGSGEIRKMGTDYLAYAIIDAAVDEYFFTLDRLEDDIENFEERAAKTNDSSFIEEIQATRKYLLQFKRAIAPVKENILEITRHETFFETDDLKPFLQDLNEHLNNVIVTVEHYREWLSNIMNVNLSVLSQQMNKVMKVLAIISTIFIPLTFIAGVYGMNFEFMPELGFNFAYPIVLGGMGLIALVMVILFKIHRWF